MRALILTIISLLLLLILASFDKVPPESETAAEAACKLT